MKFRPFVLRCECGLVPSRIRQVGLTAEHQLVIHWWCAGCRKVMFVVKDLAECWGECPKPDDAALTSSPASERERQRGDANFLHRMGIRFPADGDRR